jgi:hypothetical protein
MKSSKDFLILPLIALFFILLNSNIVYSQFYDWDTIAPLTDSVSDNTNHFLLHTYTMDQGEMMHMAWERTDSNGSKVICYRDLIQGGEPQVIASEPGVHYRNPYLVGLGYSDTIMLLFYEKDTGGEHDLLYMKFSDDRQFTGPFTLAGTGFDEREIRAGHEYGFYNAMNGRYLVNTLTWIQAGQLVNCDLMSNGPSYYFSDPVILDSGFCSDPVIVGTESIFYIRETIEGRFIYCISKQYPTGEWGEPVLFFNNGNCYNLTQDKVMPAYLAWSADSSTIFRNYLATNYPPYNGIAVGPEMDTPSDPGVCSIVIGVEPGNKSFEMYYLAFPFPDNGNEEIFMNDGWNSFPEFYNFSNSGTENRNADFYYGENYNWACFYVYLVWEEWRNQHWQIFQSKTIMCVGGVDEMDMEVYSIQAFPNPFRDEIFLNYKLSSGEFVKIEVFDLYGRKIKELYSGYQDEGEQNVTWNGNEAPPGIYLIRLQTQAFQASKRVIKL